MGCAVVLILGYGSSRDNDQAVAWVRVPSSAGHRSCRRIDCRPDIALHVQVRLSLRLLQREPDVTTESGRKVLLGRLVKGINFGERTGGDGCGLESRCRCG